MSRHFDEWYRERHDATPDWLFEVGFSTRALNAIWVSQLRDGHPGTPAELAAMSDREILKMKNCGPHTLKDIRQCLADYLKPREWPIDVCWSALYPEAAVEFLINE